MTKLIAAFGGFAYAPKKVRTYILFKTDMNGSEGKNFN